MAIETMRDAHVARLAYSVGTEGMVTYHKPEALSFKNVFGQFDLADGRLVVVPAEHFARPSDARAVIDPFLRAWELESDLLCGSGTIRFRFQGADLVDRDPPPPGAPPAVDVETPGALAVSPSATMRVTRNQYPQPPKRFRASREAETLFARFRHHLEGHESLQSMASFVLTYVQAPHGGRPVAARVHGVQLDVLNRIGQLSAPADGRPLTGSERHWLEEAVKLLIRRVGEGAPGVSPPLLAMADLPPLE